MASILKLRDENNNWISVPYVKGDKGDPGESYDPTSDTYSELETDNKTLVGAINELFTDVDNGKTLVANAITDKGVTTSSDDTFATMATNIGSISSGGINPFEGLTNGDYLCSNNRWVENEEIMNLIYSNSKNFKSAQYFFSYNEKITTYENLLDLSNINSNGINNLFNYAQYLTTIDITIPPNIIYLTRIFYGCTQLTNLNLIIEDWSIIQSLEGLFSYCQSLDGNFFNSQKNIIKIYNHTNIYYLFQRCYYNSSITNHNFDGKCLDFSNLTSARQLGFGGLFYENSYLKNIYDLDITWLYNSNANGYYKLFNYSNSTTSGCARLEHLKFKMNDDGTPMTMLYNHNNYLLNNLHNQGRYANNYTYNHDAMVETINTLPYNNSDYACDISFWGPAGGSELTEEELQVATDRGWTVNIMT